MSGDNEISEKVDLSDKWEERWNPEGYPATWIDAIGVINTFLRNFLRFFEMKSFDRVLDVGCGSGKWSAAFTILGADVTAVDIHPGMLDNVINNFPTLSRAIMLIQDDVRTLERIPNQYYEVVMSDGLIEHFLDDEIRRRVVINMINKLIPGGIFICGVPYNNEVSDEILYDDADKYWDYFRDLNVFEWLRPVEMKSKETNIVVSLFIIAKRKIY